MGYGLPAAIGAKVAAPEKIVVDIDGDASFSMTGMELATASQYNIGVKVLILNNEFQGMVLQWQDLFYEKRYSHTKMTNPDFVKLAESMFVKAIRCDNAADLPAKMKEFMEYDNNKPILFDARVVKSEHVVSLASQIVLRARACLPLADHAPFFDPLHSLHQRIQFTMYAHVTQYPMVAAGKALHECIVHPNLPELEKLQ